MSFLGVIAAGRVDHGATADVTELVLTTTAAAPVGTRLVMVILTGPQNIFGGSDGNPADPALITDDSAVSDAWVAVPTDSAPGKAYNFGSPADLRNEFDFGANGSGFNNGGRVQAVTSFTTADKPSGTNITIDTTGIGINGGDAQYVHAAVLAFSSSPTNAPQVLLAGRTIDPTETHTGAGIGVALGDWLFSDFDDTKTFIAIAGSANSPTTGVESVVDTSGNWTSEDQDGSSDCMGDSSGVVLGVFVAEGPDADPTQPIVAGFQESVHGVTAAGQSAIMLIAVPAFVVPPAGIPTFNTLVPV